MKRYPLKVKRYPLKGCRYCKHLDKHDHNIGVPCYRCSAGRFDKHGIHTCFAWHGIKKPNKAVAEAEKDCPYLTSREEIHVDVQA